MVSPPEYGQASLHALLRVLAPRALADVLRVRPGVNLQPTQKLKAKMANPSFLPHLFHHFSAMNLPIPFMCHIILGIRRLHNTESVAFTICAYCRSRRGLLEHLVGLDSHQGLPGEALFALLPPPAAGRGS